MQNQTISQFYTDNNKFNYSSNHKGISKSQKKNYEKLYTKETTSKAVTPDFLIKIPNIKKISNGQSNFCEAEIFLDDQKIYKFQVINPQVTMSLERIFINSFLMNQVNSWKNFCRFWNGPLCRINQTPSLFSMLQQIGRVATPKLLPRHCLRYLQTTLIIGGGGLVSEVM